ncbi:MAG: hypothetical protein GEU90_05285 [Gemmatimonas sp.]|nr:hypothetical protein [Gemmatimonas sp.]
MIGRIVFSEIRHRPGRFAFLLCGYALGVAVMVVLLAVGEAMLTQARDRSLVGGGDLIVVPAGITPEMLKAGGTSALFLGLEQARFIQRQVLESPRGRDSFGVEAASPLVDSRIVHISRGGRELPAIATGEIPSRSAAVGGAPDLIAGSWSDSDADRRWAEPEPGQLYDEIDSFHRPYGAALGDSTWAEWHYFNILIDSNRWVYLTYMIGGRVGEPGEWGGQLLLTSRSADGVHRSYTHNFPDTTIEFDTARAGLVLSPGISVSQTGGAYTLTGSIEGAELELRISPSPNHIFPPTEIGGGDLVSGYVVPALSGTANGRICVPSAAGPICDILSDAPAYHDHNWGVWRNVAWEWGAASDQTVSLLYGSVAAPGEPDPGLFAYLVDGAGVRGVFRPERLDVTEAEAVEVDGVELQVPTELLFEDSRRGLAVRIDVHDRHITDMHRSVARYFVQMRGLATVTEAGQPPRELEGFFETYVDPADVN